MAGINDLDDFLAGMDEEIAAVAQTALAETRQAAEVALRTAVRGTPEVTGLHKGSWEVGVGADPGPSGNHPDPGGAATIGRGLSAIEASQPRQPIIIVNDGPAIVDLDEGRSDQAPEGFSLRAVIAAARKD